MQSQSDTKKQYTVKLKNRNRWVCDCPDSTYRKAQCKHALMVAAQVADCEALKILNGDGSDMEQRLQELLEQYPRDVLYEK